MARHKTFLSTRQESMQRTVHDTRKRNGQIMEHKTEELIALPPVRATTSSDHQPENRQLSPLSKWQIQRCSSPNPGNCQEELVNEWLHRNHIRVVQRLPKMDPIVLTSRGADVSKYISFIRPPPFSLKVLSTEDRRSRENTHRTTVSASEPSTPCPRLLRSQRSDREMFPLNPVIRVGGGYRRLSWKVLDVLPSIGQYDPDFSPDYRCASCNAILPVTEKVTNSRGQLRTILATPKTCHKCGTPTTDYQALTENDLHESVQDTLHRGDSRFIVDHRRFYNSRDSRSRPKKNERVSPASSSPMDWHEDMESFRIHMSRQSYQDDDLETRNQASEQKRSESGSGVFITEPGEDINNINEPPDVRRAWDDGSASADVTREYGNTSGDWGKAKETGSGLSDNDNDSFDDFEMIEDYDPETGFTVLLRRRPFGGTQQNSYLIHGVQDEEGTGKKGRKHGHRDEKTVRKEYETGHSRKKANKHISADQKANRQILHDINGNEEELNNEEQKENRTNRRAKNLKHSFPRTDSFYAVGLDRRDYVFSEEPILQETDEDSVMIDPRTRFSENSLSDIEFDADSWSPGPLVNGTSRPSVPSPVDKDYADYSSSLSISPEQHDGYLADSEENADLSSLQAQIQQARNDAKKNQRRREEGKETRRKESKGRKEKATEGSLPQNPPDEDGSNRAPLNSGEWDSDWDSDFSLHVQPLSDLSVSSSEDEPWENGTQRRTSNLESQERSRKVSDKTTANVSRRKGSRPNDTDLHKGAMNGGADREGARRSSAGETRVRDRKSSRHTIVKPVPKIGPGSDSEDAIPRPRLRAPRDEDDLSESDLSFFSQQFQAPYPMKDQEIGPNNEGPAGCKGINCYRCGAFIPECQGVCAKCGTLCQRPGGPCNACRDICESCGKPRYKCTSAEKRLKASEDEEREEKDIDSDELEAGPTVQENSKRTSRGEDHSPVQVSADKIGVDRKGSGSMVGEQNFQKKRERKNRAPTERKRKDVNNIKRVRTKRNQNSLNDDEEHESENELVNGVDEEKDALEIEKLETHRESAETILIEELPSKPEPSAYSNKSTKKTKPSKKVISQTVLYKEKEKPSKQKQKSLQEENNSHNIDSVVTSPTPSVETAESGAETLPTEREGTGEEVRSTEQRVRDESVVDENNVSDDVINKPEEGEKAGNEEKMAEEKEKEEQRQMELEEKKRNVIPKIRGVMRVNAAFKDRVELVKRLQSVLKEAISDVIGQADMKTRKDSTIDYLAQYRLVERSHLEMYGRAFTLEDGDEDGIISYEQMLLALEGVPSIAGMSRKQLLFVLQVLELFPGSRITFKMFSVMTALCEKVTVLDAFVKQLMEELNLFDLECKLDMFRNMFFVTGDYSVNFITADQLRIELKAGGLNQQQEDHVIGHVLQSTQPGEISFLDYMAYLPLFLSIHQNICDNALDMSRNKYQRSDTT